MKLTGLALSILIIITLSLLLSNLRITAAVNYIHIKSDGTIEPSTAPIVQKGNYYKLIAHIHDRGILIERDNSIFDGNGYFLIGSGEGWGIYLNGTENVTIQNAMVSSFKYGIMLSEMANASMHSKNNSISTSFTANNEYGIYLVYSSKTSIFENDIKNNTYGIALHDSLQNNIYRNDVKENQLGIWLWWSDNNSIYDNNLSLNLYGVVFWGTEKNQVFQNNVSTNTYDGLVLFESRINNIFENNITANSRGIWLRYSSANNNISKNYINKNYYGFQINASQNNILSKNTITNNTFNFSVEGEEPIDFAQMVDDTNLINGKPIIYILNQRNLSLSFSTPYDVGYLGLINCDNAIIRFATLTNNGQGLLLINSNNSRISDCIIKKNNYGLWLGWANNNTILVNNVTDNNYGIWVHASALNRVYYNNFLGNTLNAYSQNTSNNNWDDGYPHGGNFWSNYGGVDLLYGVFQNETGYDGIGDNPYAINQYNFDFYPLMKMRLRINTDLNMDGYVGIDDLIIAAEAFGSTSLKGRWNQQADVNKDDYVGIDDAIIICNDFGKSWRPQT